MLLFYLSDVQYISAFVCGTYKENYTLLTSHIQSNIPRLVSENDIRNTVNLTFLRALNLPADSLQQHPIQRPIGVSKALSVEKHKGYCL